MKQKEIEIAELKGLGKCLDLLWENSYYGMGKKASERIETELIYFFGKNWSKDMYDFIGQNDGCRLNMPKTLKEILTK